MKTPSELSEHVSDLAAAFHVRLDIDPARPVHDAGAGYRIIRCPQCNTPNAIRRVGTLRCGHCKHPLGTHDVAHSVMIAPVIDETSYAVALHELGHCVHPTGRVNEFEGSMTMRATFEVGTLRDMRLQLLEEESAWLWARVHALEWTPVMARVESEALNTYRRFARKLGIK